MTTTAFAQEAAHVRKIGHLSDGDIARATGAGISTVGAWIRGNRTPSGKRAQRLAELSALVERLVRVMNPDYVPVWLNKPLDTLGDDKPLDQIAAGRYREVAKLISQLESPTFS